MPQSHLPAGGSRPVVIGGVSDVPTSVLIGQVLIFNFNLLSDCASALDLHVYAYMVGPYKAAIPSAERSYHFSNNYGSIEGSPYIAVIIQQVYFCDCCYIFVRVYIFLTYLKRDGP